MVSKSRADSMPRRWRLCSPRVSMFASWTFMPESKLILVFFEGNDDKAFLEKLRATNLLPGNWELAKRSREDHAGKDGLVRQLLPFVRPVSGVGGNAIVLVDLDDLNFEQRFDWFRNQLRQGLHGSSPSVDLQDGPAINERVLCLRLTAA